MTINLAPLNDQEKYALVTALYLLREDPFLTAQDMHRDDPDISTQDAQKVLDLLTEAKIAARDEDMHSLLHERSARDVYAQLTGEVQCEKCGCTDTWACRDGCYWVSPGLCSGCAGISLRPFPFLLEN